MTTDTGSKLQHFALYCRVSSDEQAQSGTIQNQLDFARRYADLHGLDIVETYTDDGVSGTIDPARRPAGREMLAGAKAGRFNVLVVYRLDRLSRKLAHLLATHETLEGWGVSIRSMTEPLDTSSPVGRFVFQLLGSMAELERETIRQRTDLGRERALSNGRAMGRRPFGYTLGENGLLVAEPTEAPIAVEIFTLAAQGDSAGSIAVALNRRKVPPLAAMRGYRPRTGVWRHSAVLSILHNPVYWAGKWQYRRADGTVWEVPAPTLVQRAVAIRARDSLAHSKPSGRSLYKYLLSGIIRCSCGAAMVGSATKPTNPYYCCSQRKSASRRRHELGVEPSCDMRPVRADELDRKVWADMLDAMSDPAMLAGKVAEKLSQASADVEAARAELEAASREYETLMEQRLQAQLRADRGEVTPEDLSRYLRAGVARVNELERRQRELAERLALRQVDEAQIATAEEVCRGLLARAKEAEGDPELQRELLRAVVQSVVIIQEGEQQTAKVEYVAANTTTLRAHGTADKSIDGVGWYAALSILPKYSRMH